VSTPREAYTRTGPAWQRGPGMVYDHLADELVACAPGGVEGNLALDVGAGTGAATRALRARGARVIALDAAIGMLQASVPRPVAVVGDATALPLRDDSVDLVVAAFSLNHLSDPAAGIREAARVTAPGGHVLGSAYAEDDTHPAKEAVEAAASRFGWVVPEWYPALRAEAIPKLATAERARDAVLAAGCSVGLAEQRRVPFPHLGPTELVEWRIGMAQLAPFVATLSHAQREALVADASAALRGSPPLVRSIVVFVALV
jgi:SAM-dependent methyltransferase